MKPLEPAQTAVLQGLLKAAAGTVYGRAHGFVSVRTAAEYAARVPLSSYADFEPYIERAKQGEADVLWPGIVTRFAVSSGTTGKGKHLPVTDRRIQSDIRFMRRVSARILRDYPNPALFLGRHAALSGSVEQVGHLQMGEISGMLACATPWWMRGLHCLCPKRAASMGWEERYERLVCQSMNADLRLVSGVPSWLLLFFREVSKRRGLPLHQVWPNLKLVITGGVALSGYLPALRSLLDPMPVRFLENYGASEGYYAFGWQADGNMALQYDSNLYYEFIPFQPWSTHGADTCVPLWEVETGRPYNLVVSSDAGLWRYVTNDVVTFDTLDPPRLRVTGRADEMTDTFGEALSAAEARAAFAQVWPGPPPDHLHIKPVWDSSTGLPRHHWLLVFQTPPPSFDFGALANQLDRTLTANNRHYAIRRNTGALMPPKMTVMGHDAHARLLAALPRSQSKLGMFI